MNKYRRLVFKGNKTKNFWRSEPIFVEVEYIISMIQDNEYMSIFICGRSFRMQLRKHNFDTYQQAEDACNEHFIKELSRFEE